MFPEFIRFNMTKINRESVLIALFLWGWVMMSLCAQDSVTHYYAPNPGVKRLFSLVCNESAIQPYALPDPLLLDNGKLVTEADIWWRQKRPEILSLFENEMYGKTPLFSQAVTGFRRNPRIKIINEKKDVFNGKATRREIRLYFMENDEGFQLDILLYIPNRTKKTVPAYVMLNFRGNQSVTDDRDILIGTSWMSPSEDGTVSDFRSTEKSRGVAKSRWPIEMMIDRGYALATACYQQIAPDYADDGPNEIQAVFRKKGQIVPALNEWGSIGIWAWGMSRILDYLETEPRINPTQIVAAGHSRLGKTALWAGAQDPRFAIVIANNSGCGGAALSKRIFGETIDLLCYVRPHWFCKNYNYYANNEKTLPFDQHELIALIAPRPVYIATAEEDWEADPKGEYLSLLNADAVYRLLGTNGIGDKDCKNCLLKRDQLVYDARIPDVNQPTGETIGFHVRTGKHDVTRYDWEQFLNFTDRHFKWYRSALFEDSFP